MFITVFKPEKDIDILQLDLFIRHNIQYTGEAKSIHSMVYEMGLENDVEDKCIEKDQLKNLHHHLGCIGTLNNGGSIFIYKNSKNDIYYLGVETYTCLNDPDFDHISRVIIASDIIDYIYKNYGVEVSETYEDSEEKVPYNYDKTVYSFVVA